MNRIHLISVVAALTVVVALVGAGVVRAGGAPTLPAIRADRLLASTAVALAGQVTIAGDVRTHVDLGLPEVPSVISGEGGAVAMIGGTQRLRVWHAPEGLRLAHVTQVGERDLVVNPRAAWWWDATAMTATRVRAEDLRRVSAGGLPGLSSMIPAGDGSGHGSGALAASAAAYASDPIEAARTAIDALAPYASVTVDGTDRIAGRSTYDLVLTPLSDRTLIGSIELAIDAESRLPLRFEVFARDGTDAALSAGFTSVSYEPIDPSVFTFTPPPRADVTDPLKGLGSREPSVGDAHEGDRAGGAPGAPEIRVFGSGFETRVAVASDTGLPDQLRGLLPYAGPLFSVTEVDHGTGHWFVIGAVPLDVVRADADALP